MRRRKQIRPYGRQNFDSRRLTSEELNYANFHRNNSFRGKCALCSKYVYVQVSGMNEIRGKPVHVGCLARAAKSAHSLSVYADLTDEKYVCLICGEEVDQVYVCQACEKKVCNECFDSIREMCTDCIRRRITSKI